MLSAVIVLEVFKELRLIINLSSENGIRLPIHYNSIIQAAIYNSITPELAEFLHDQGFKYEKRSFKMFSFSRIMGQYDFNNKNKELLFQDKFSLHITSPINVFCEELANIMLLSGNVKLGSNIVNVDKVEVVNSQVSSETAYFRTLSPIVVYSTVFKPNGEKYTCYYQPGDKEFKKQIGGNLQKKFISLFRKKPPLKEIGIEKKGSIKQNILIYKGFVIKGYSCTLKVQAPREILQLGLDAGLGAKNSQGFGCVDILD